jgi:hypothetical protein
MRIGSRTSNHHFTRDVLRADGTRAYVGYGMDSLTVGLVAVCRVKFAGDTRDAVASLYPTAEEARITCAIVDAAGRVRDLNRCDHPEGMAAISRGLRSAPRDDTPGANAQRFAP